MKKALIPIIAIVVVIVAVFAGSYNSLVSKQTDVENGAATIDTQLQRRMDLIPNLVETVQGFASHETEVFSAVTEARENMMKAGTMSEKAEANEEMTSALGRLLAVAEAYPELKSDKVFTSLMDELSGTENRIAYARDEYNSVATIYNKAIRKFPTVIFANMFGFEKADLFKAKEGADVAPTVDF